MGKKNRDIGEHKKSRHAKFQWIPSNLKNSNEIGTYASLPRSPSIVYKSATHDAITNVFRLTWDGMPRRDYRACAAIKNGRW